MKESQFSRLVLSNIKKYFPESHPTRIEGSSVTGIADINVCHGSLEMWLELKIVLGDKVGLRPSQQAWTMERSKQGQGAVRRMHVLIRKHDALYLVNTVDLIRNGLSLKRTPKEFETSKPFDWKELFIRLENFSTKV